MTYLTRWNPWRELGVLNRMGGRDWTMRWPTVLEEPAIDMYETDEGLVVKATVPGVKPEDIDIKIVGDTLTIKGETKEDRETKDRNYVYRERHLGSFSRVISVPDVDASKVTAEFENGILTLTLPKVAAAQPRTVQVKAK